MTLKHALGFLALVLVLSQAACSVRAAGFDQIGSSDSETTLSFDNKTDVQTRIFACREGMRSVRFGYHSRVEAGQAAWVLMDPQGHVRWSSADAERSWFSRTRRFEAIPGDWKLKIALVQASGRYEARWSASTKAAMFERLLKLPRALLDYLDCVGA